MVSTPEPQHYINFYFQVHQPRRLRRFQFFDIGSSSTYFDDAFNRDILSRVAANCYLPANKLLLKLIARYPNIRITFSLSGTFIEQMKACSAETLASFRSLAETGAVEFLGETYYHSLASLLDEDEFAFQVDAHRMAIRDCFRFDPKVFRNTELIYSDETGQAVKDLGFEGIYVDGIESLLRGASANQVYAHPSGGMILFPRNYKLSDDIAFRYSDPTWSEWPLTSETFLRWINQMPSSAFTCLGMDYETLGEHQKRTGGILEFMEGLLTGLAQQKRISFINPSEAQGRIMPVATLSAQGTISWADHERDVSAWLGNEMQRDAFDSLRKLLPKIVRSADSKLLRHCRHLQTSDHFYYMSTKGGSDGQVHQYFSPYNSPYEAFMNYMNVLSDIAYRLKTGELKTALNTAIGTAL